MRPRALTIPLTAALLLTGVAAPAHAAPTSSAASSTQGQTKAAQEAAATELTAAQAEYERTTRNLMAATAAASAQKYLVQQQAKSNSTLDARIASEGKSLSKQKQKVATAKTKRDKAKANYESAKKNEAKAKAAAKKAKGSKNKRKANTALSKAQSKTSSAKSAWKSASTSYDYAKRLLEIDQEHYEKLVASKKSQAKDVANATATLKSLQGLQVKAASAQAQAGYRLTKATLAKAAADAASRTIQS